MSAGGAVPPRTMGELLERLEALERTLPPSDGVRWFTRLYREATGDILTALGDGEFEDGPFLEALGVRCGIRYLDAVAAAEAGRPVARCWSPLLELRAVPLIAPVQFGIAGLNAHMEHDLPVELVALWAEHGLGPGAAPEHRDFAKLDDLIARSEHRVKAWLLTGAIKEVDRLFDGDEEVVANWTVARAHDAAWITGGVLWELRGVPPLRDAYAATVDRTVGLASRLLLVPTGLG